MSHFHPSNELLTEYAAGSLTPAFLACVGSHLHYCHECRQQVESQEQVASTFLEELTPIPVSDDVLTNTLAQIDSGCIDLSHAPQDNSSETALSYASFERLGMPSTVAKLTKQPLEDLEWEPAIKGIDIHHLKVGDVENELSLYRIQPGCAIPHHTHKGEELMQLMQGSFSDHRGVYLTGDFVECTPSLTHAPVAAEGQACICLVALSAPLKFTGAFRRLVNPFLTINPQ